MDKQRSVTPPPKKAKPSLHPSAGLRRPDTTITICVGTLSNGIWLKSLTDSITDLKTTVAPLVKTTGEVKNSAIPSLIQQVAEIDELVGKVMHGMRALEEQNKNILGTLEAQDKDLTNLEARFKLFEEQTEKTIKAKHLGGGAVPGSDEEEVGGNNEGRDNVKLRNNSLNSFVRAAFYGLMGIEERSEQLKDPILRGYWVPDTSSKTPNDDQLLRDIPVTTTIILGV
ncbi:hypothetical protein JB92DRAFT_3110983 [Gautieria morchelliformis]|nr:hypothetical protein JB92DRAFT_3110983 [Gautieria morchelliformis]